MVRRIIERLRHPALVELVRDQDLQRLLRRKEFRVTDTYLQREVLDRTVDEELREVAIRFREGYGELQGKVKKRLVPVNLPFSVRFRLDGVEFNPMGKRIHLRIDEVKPLDLDWVTKRLVEKVPFLSCAGDRITCDLAKVPRLAGMLATELKGVRVVDFVTIRELALVEGALVGRLGVCL